MERERKKNGTNFQQLKNVGIKEAEETASVLMNEYRNANKKRETFENSYSLMAWVSGSRPVTEFPNCLPFRNHVSVFNSNV
jgi:predicted type IV restriction endonuclease